MACECISTVNKLLQPRNTRLGLTFVFSDPISELPTLVVEQIEKGRGKPKAVAMLPSFCPFCGTKYKAEEVAEAA